MAVTNACISIDHFPRTNACISIDHYACISIDHFPRTNACISIDHFPRSIFSVQHILNISREIDNFYPGILHYMNVREWDVEQSDLMKYWEDTYKFINKARYAKCRGT